MRNLLFISISFPPKNDPECIQTARYFKYLVQANKFNVDVVTSKRPTLYMPEDSSLTHYFSGFRQLIELPVLESKMTNIFLRKVGLGRVMHPDSKMLFHWQWKKVLKQLREVPDIIYSRSNPISSAFMAKKLKQTFKVPWVMHMSDPWALSPLRSNTSNQAREDEYELLSSADMVTFTTGKTCELYKQAYPEYATRMRVLPNVFDPDDIVNQTKSQGKHPKFRIVYTGGLTQQRPLHFIEKVLETLKQKDEVIFGKFEILFAGPMDRYGRKFFKHYKQKNVMHLGELSYVDVQELQRTADVLLVLDSPTTSKDAIFFPSKLLDYFLTSRPILAITPEGSSTRDILTNYPSQCFVHDDYQGIANFIFDRIETRLVHQPIQFDPPNKYSAKTNAALLIELLCSLDREKEYKHQS